MNSMDKIMRQYSYLHELEKPKDDYKNDKELASYIDKNFDKLTKEEKISIFLKIVQENKLDKELLRYQIKNSIPKKKNMDILSFLTTVKAKLNRYHKKAGGMYIEDSEWGYHEKKNRIKNTTKYVLSNTIDVLEGRDREIYEYMSDLAEYLNKISQFSVSYNITEDNTYKISYVEIVIE